MEQHGWLMKRECHPPLFVKVKQSYQARKLFLKLRTFGVLVEEEHQTDQQTKTLKRLKESG
jgi:hypothetical protein